MANSNTKGKRGERRFRDIVNEALPDEYNFERIGNAEQSKKWLHGDIHITKGDEDKCVLTDYFLEAKRQAQPSIWRVMDEAEENAEQYDFKGSIAYVSRASKSQDLEEVISMRPQVFISLIKELQELRQRDYERLKGVE